MARRRQLHETLEAWSGQCVCVKCDWRRDKSSILVRETAFHRWSIEFADERCIYTESQNVFHCEWW